MSLPKLNFEINLENISNKNILTIQQSIDKENKSDSAFSSPSSFKSFNLDENKSDSDKSNVNQCLSWNKFSFDKCTTLGFENNDYESSNQLDFSKSNFSSNFSNNFPNNSSIDNLTSNNYSNNFSNSFSNNFSNNLSNGFSKNSFSDNNTSLFDKCFDDESAMETSNSKRHNIDPPKFDETEINQIRECLKKIDQEHLEDCSTDNSEVNEDDSVENKKIKGVQSLDGFTFTIPAIPTIKQFDKKFEKNPDL
jgi:hypothetical protein